MNLFFACTLSACIVLILMMLNKMVILSKALNKARKDTKDFQDISFEMDATLEEALNSLHASRASANELKIFAGNSVELVKQLSYQNKKLSDQVNHLESVNRQLRVMANSTVGAKPSSPKASLS